MMKLAKEQVDKLTELVLKRLKEKDLVVFKADEAKVLGLVREVVMDDIRAEDSLDREVERILETHSREIESGKVDYKKMFQMIKTKLARERGLVL